MRIEESFTPQQPMHLGDVESWVREAHRYAWRCRRVELQTDLALLFENPQTLAFRWQECLHYERCQGVRAGQQLGAWYPQCLPGGLLGDLPGGWGWCARVLWGRRGCRPSPRFPRLPQVDLQPIDHPTPAHRISGRWRFSRTADPLAPWCGWLDLRADALSRAAWFDSPRWEFRCTWEDGRTMGVAVPEPVWASLTADIEATASTPCEAG